MNNIVTEGKNLKKSFGTNHVLKDVSFTLKQGENLVIFGKSGSGKSILLKCLIGLIPLDDGVVTLFDKKLDELSGDELNNTRKKVGFLFQSAALYDSMTVRENLEFPLRDLPPQPPDETEKLIVEALSNVGLEKAIDKMPSELSGGMRKRLGLARSLMLKPNVILYDEPTTGLDTMTSKEISELILEVQEKFNTASIIVTHDVNCARLTANRMIILKDGMVEAEGTFEELSKSDDEWVRSFFG